MDELVEKIARAIEKGEKRWIGIDPGSPAFCRNAAQVALAAIDEAHAIVPKEPTEAMLKAGEGALDMARETDYDHDGPCGEYVSSSAPYDIYLAMIEAASPQSPPTGDR